ncbi:MAG: two-component system, NtrC family, nitrogen regulation sensor histidine kinase GlnL [Verrucomicrobiota bacterium]|jgi:signal transduction histidine kinase
MQSPRDGNASPGQELPSFPAVLNDCLAGGLLILDANRQIVLCTPQAAAILGMEASAVAHHSFTVLPAGLQAILENGVADSRNELRIAHPAGERWVQAAVHVETDSAGAVARWILILNDVTGMRAFEQSMRHLDRLASIGTLSAGMAHEIKNAMVAVKTFLDILIRNHQDAQLAEVVNREMHRINAIVSQMLRFAGPAKPTFATVHLHDVIEQSLCLVQHQLEGRRISVIRAMTAAPDAVRGDGYQLEQVFLNLFFNAFDAMGSSGDLTVSTEVLTADQSELVGTPALRIRVQDTGVGIPPENLRRLFEPFFTTKSNGTGLGLPITRRIVQEHRGVITVASEPGQGATFDILLPLATTASPKLSA